ncbi:MAG: helix-turn-helix transcriptional regulator [Lachnospiraceae bacterium]|nr:helix-turn-helix transcriptional regulator [Lachnospiraceae bacterium]MBQ9135470.1 helix-turn-helix transcriptional regulator [Lachnospiraceae bacterium]
MDTFQDRLRALRIAHGLTQEQLSAMLRVSRSAVGMYENGLREPDYETLNNAAEYFNVSIDYLLGREKITDNINIVLSEEDCRYNQIRKKVSNGEKISHDELAYFRTETLGIIKEASSLFKRYSDELEEVYLQALIDDYCSLNSDGKLLVRKIIEALAETPRYTAASSPDPDCTDTDTVEE